MRPYLFKHIGILSIFCTAILLICLTKFCFTAEETLTLTTYYPAPYGFYRWMRVDGMSVGPGYRYSDITNGTLIVEGRVGIGTTDTSATILNVYGGNASAGTVVADIVLQAQNAAFGGGGDGGNIILIPGAGSAGFMSGLPGNVGINTQNPQGKLHVDPLINGPDGNPGGGDDSNDDFVVTQAGKVGIGTDNPTAASPMDIPKLTIKTDQDNGYQSGLLIRDKFDNWRLGLFQGLPNNGDFNPITVAGDAAILFTRGWLNSDKALVIAPWYNASGAGVPTGIRITSTGQVAICATNPGDYNFWVGGKAGGSGDWVASSDLRLKKNIEELTGVLDKISAIRGVTFDWRFDEFPNKGLSTEKQVGLIAQEVEQSFPELVSNDPDGFKALAYDRFTAVLLEAIQEQQQEIETQQRAIEAQRGNIVTQEQQIEELQKEVAQLKLLFEAKESENRE